MTRAIHFFCKFNFISEVYLISSAYSSFWVEIHILIIIIIIRIRIIRIRIRIRIRIIIIIYFLSTKRTDKREHLFQYIQQQLRCHSNAFCKVYPSGCMCRIWWSCEGLTSVHNKYTGWSLKYLLLRHMYNPVITNLCATLPARLNRLRWACAPDCVCWPTACARVSPRTVLYDAFYKCLCRRYWNGILGPSIFMLV